MNTLQSILFASIMLVTTNAFATSPPDSISTIVDRAAAALLVEEARTLYQEGKVRDALIKFRQAGVKDPYSWKPPYWISRCHYKMNNYGLSLKYALEAKSTGKDKVNDEIHWMLGTVYHRLGNIDTAIIHYDKSIELLSKRRVKELRIEHKKAEAEYAKEALENGAESIRTRLPGLVNSGYDDYNVVILEGGTSMYFTSRRSNTTGGQLNPDDQQYFEDIYLAKYDSDFNEWGELSNELGKLNSDGFDAINYVSTAGDYAVITLNTTATEEKVETKGSDICELKLNKKGTWNTPKIIKNKSINTSFFEGSATLTADGNRMFFVTDRKGDKSSTDIYMVQKDGKSWGEAAPLPMTINTTGRETTPYITPDGKYLFFSSDGHLGMGGLDVYVAEYKGDGNWGGPVNLGPTVNTVNNDTHFVYAKDLGKGFISGYEVVGKKASIDIYEIDLSNFEIPAE